MGIFKRTKPSDDTVGVELQPGGVALTLMRRDGQARNVVTLAEYEATSPDRHAECLQQMVHRHRLRGAPCVGVLTHGSYELLQVEPPDVPEDERDQAIRWRLRDLVDFPIEQAVVEVFPQPEQPNRRAASVNAAVSREDVVRRSIDTLTGAGLDLQALDIAELAQRNLIARYRDNAHGVAVLQLDEQSGLLVLVRESELYLARDFDIGLARLRGAFEADGGASTAAFDSLVLELQRSLDYYESNFRLPAINRLMLHPAEPCVRALIEHIAANLRSVRARILEPAEVVHTEHPLPAQCLNALGAAMRQIEVAA